MCNRCFTSTSFFQSSPALTKGLMSSELKSREGFYVFWPADYFTVLGCQLHWAESLQKGKRTYVWVLRPHTESTFDQNPLKEDTDNDALLLGHECWVCNIQAHIHFVRCPKHFTPEWDKNPHSIPETRLKLYARQHTALFYKPKVSGDEGPQNARRKA